MYVYIYNIYIYIICKTYRITKVVNANSWNVANYTHFHMPMPSTVCGTALPSIINVYNCKACTLLSSNKNSSNRCILFVAHWPNHDEGPQRRSFLPEALAFWAKGSWDRRSSTGEQANPGCLYVYVYMKHFLWNYCA
jgi:hypothetical protein